MSTIESKIPAFSLWKMFNDTLIDVFKFDHKEETVRRLATIIKIIKSKEFENTFVFEKDSIMSFPEYQKIADIYKSYSTWILGRFFYVLNREKLLKIHHTIIDAQLYILEHLSKTQLNVYVELTWEYSKALNLLAKYFTDPDTHSNKLILNIFEPAVHEELADRLDLTPIYVKIDSRKACIELLLNVIKFFKYILPENFVFHNFNKKTLETLDDLLTLLNHGTIKMKLAISEVYIEILSKIRFHKHQYAPEVEEKLDLFYIQFENIVYYMYNTNTKVAETDFVHFERGFDNFLSYSCAINNVDEKLNRITKFIFDKESDKNSLPSPHIKKKLMKNIQKLTYNFDSGTSLEDFLIPNINSYNMLKINVVKKQIQSEILTYCSEVLGCKDKEVKVFSGRVSHIWSIFWSILLKNLEDINCGNICQLEQFFIFFNELSIMLLEILLEIRNKLLREHNWLDVSLIFYEEGKLFSNVIKKFNVHFNECSNDLNSDLYMKFFMNCAILSHSKNLDIIFSILSFPFLRPKLYSTVREIPCSFIGNIDAVTCKETLQHFYGSLEKLSIRKYCALVNVENFLIAISSGILQNLNSAHVQFIEDIYLKISKDILSENEDLQSKMMDIIPHIITLFPRSEQYLEEVLITMISKSNVKLQGKIINVFGPIICTCSSDFIKVLQINYEENKLDSLIYCEKCCLRVNSSNEKASKLKQFFQENFQNKIITDIDFCSNRIDMSSISTVLLNHTLKSLTKGDVNMKIASLKILPFLANHILKFNSSNATKIWVERAGDIDPKVRETFAEVVWNTLRNGQANTVLSSDVKKEILEIVLSTILQLSKKSLQYSDFPLQNSLLWTMESIINLNMDQIVLPIVQILLYFIMVPTSKYSMVAVNRFFYLAEKQKKKPYDIYMQFTNQICETIVHLCCVNQTAANYNLATSLGKISVILEFMTTKHFVASESQYLLPLFVSKVVKIPQVTNLIEEMAGMMDMEISDMLAGKYGYIFLHVFLNQGPKGDFKECLNYLEQTAGMSGPSLRKKNFRVILNHLLLNFHDKKENVILALHLLAQEDNESSNIPDYLQSHFLGVLQFFLITILSRNSKNEQVLQSLSKIFQFMGSKHIVPLRFKIISMLQTADHANYPELISDVWDAFLRSCEAEVLGPQLATIFVSLQPLLGICPGKINAIYKYLIVENEAYCRDYIKDLFFISDSKLDKAVTEVLAKYMEMVKKYSFKDKIRLFLKYLTHETVEVRIQGLRELKRFMEVNREELDQMILGYNGIDETIVNLIDILTLTCREKDEQLKLTCGEVIGELGAVEPSHLPRRYAQTTQTFAFFIYEDSFIVSALNELIKAIQAEKNALNMDRTALAVQEILKTYEISPVGNCNKHELWEQFSEAQQELMVPLLSSRYTISRSVNSNYVSTIYGSSLGASFQSWLYNWTCSLISTLPNERKSLLEACLPSMKEGHRVLLHFLPHILLHALIEGTTTSRESNFEEFQTVINSFNTKQKLDPNVLNVIGVPLPGIIPSPQVITPEEVKQTECTKIVFVLLDFLNRWLREWQWKKGAAGRTDSNFLIVKNFLKRFCKLQLAKCNYQCGEYPRALMYLEDFMTENPVEFSDHLSFLAEIYAQLDEPDGVTGTTALRQREPSIEERILALEVSGKLGDAAACYERMTPPLKLHHLQGLVRCYLNLDNVNTALNFAQGAMNTHIEFGNMLLEMQAEPLWRLSRYDDLDKLLDKPEMKNNKSWGVQIGKALIHFKKGERNHFKQVLDNLRVQQVNLLGAATLEEGAYQHGYSYISHLHALNELQQVEKAIHELLHKPNDDSIVKNIVKRLKNEWELRIKVVQESVRIIEPILCLRRVALEQAKQIVASRAPNAIPYLNSLLGECWLLSAKTSRSARMHQQAYTYTLKAEQFAPPELFLEKAKLYWLREEHEQALTTLKRGVEIILPESSTRNIEALSPAQSKLCAEAKLLIATYNDTTSNVESEVLKHNYKEAADVCKEWEKSLVCLAQYYDRIFQTCPESERDVKYSDIQLHMINWFGKSLQYGNRYVYQSMPRLLSIWFDYGSRILDVSAANSRDERRNHLFNMTKLIDNFLNRLPVYIFLTAFSQLVSRICHPQKEVYIELKSIIIKLLLHYPQQTLWMIIPVIKSSYSIRAKRCSEILNDARLKGSSLAKLVKDFTSLAEKLIELCNKEISQDVNTVTVSALLRSLPRMLSKDDFSEIMMPTQKFRKLVLPNPDFKSSQHNPFPNQYVHIVGIDDEITVLQSLQRPRKISLRGSDGKSYIQMLKPKDDLRKDFRLMEFNDIVNQLLSREAEARERRLNIRLYSVAPLNEECGLIEWVPNLVGLRIVVMNLYRQHGFGMRAKELKEVSCNIRDPLAKKRDVFTKHFLARHPPILGEWFRKKFPDAQNWLTARTAYIRTTAVMSMVGYILGLGDRHGENILLDSICGDAVHVDFNCLFNKGESFEWPERVPFRLTQNMVSAMGPLGVEGVFRKSCACTLRVLRTNAPTLMSIVTPFVYDPLVSWPRNAPSSTHPQNAERTNEQAVDHIKNIELRLQGIIKTRARSLSIPLSVEGQTNNLISEAINIDNLCQMYVGWGPYL